jgi:hypothetical protein
MMIKLKQICELHSGGYYKREIRVNTNNIHYYYRDILQIPCEPDIEVTKVVIETGNVTLMVTETLEEIDAAVAGRPVR